jgi:hypothetical protein
MTSFSGTEASTATGRAANVASDAKSQAHDVADTAREKAQDVAATAKSHSEELVGEAKDKVQLVAGDLREEARRHADEQGRRAAEALHDTSRQLQSMAQSSEQQGLVVDLVKDLASRVDRFANQVEYRGLDGILSDVRSFARRQPGTFLFAAGAAGFLVGRLVRSASGTASPSSGSMGTSQPTYAPAPIPGAMTEGRP